MRKIAHKYRKYISYLQFLFQLLLNQFSRFCHCDICKIKKPLNNGARRRLKMGTKRWCVGNWVVFTAKGGCCTLFVACHQESWGIPADHSVRQQDIQELGHVSHFFLEDSAVHYKHNRSGEMSERGWWWENMWSGHDINLVIGNFTSNRLRVIYMCWCPALTWLQIWTSPGIAGEDCHVLAGLSESRCCPECRRERDSCKPCSSWNDQTWR